MNSGILGLHHVTATADAAQADLDFFTGALALRLVKRTVNFDNHSVYHFYYGDERGTPGTIWTTFPYRGHGVRIGTKGAGQITVTSFSVPRGALAFWRPRLAQLGFRVLRDTAHFGEPGLVAEDPSGLEIALVESDDARAAWPGSGLAASHAIRGLHSVTMTIAAPDLTIAFMTKALGFEVVRQEPGRTRLAAGGTAAAGHVVDLAHAPDAPRAINGLGTVHHVAFAVADADEQQRFRRDLLQLGAQVTPVMDRQYFTSIYFREPGGVLFEIATMGPGFLVDEPMAALGEHLKLPPWEEPNRAGIERGLAPIRVPVPAAS